MSRRPKIKISVVGKLGQGNCHRGHRIGDAFDFDTERGKLCPLAMHVLFPMIDTLRYGGSFPWEEQPGTGEFCCPDPKVATVFRIEREE
ncbi:TIGR04076 family protein [Desulforamulus ferrireducens]|uniref:TIGR04076 family protein n=1 Tax=Desulforamulus ferrireducens TaxID=1833852 RepID=A0A1S6IWE7_9FIRM|nr:TIGR04076 family protein [Desulforamulus ferrireducens]AQS59104.1 TIGR04076 family protein [Desulforamulus ferrireducens]